MSSEENNAADDSSVTNSSPDPEFVQLFTKAQRRLYLFILSQMPRPADADEILQETNLVIWRKYDSFELGTNFLAWCCRIASYEVLKHRDRYRRDRHFFSQEFVEQVGREVLQDAELLEERRRALAHCLGKLRSSDRELIQQRYAPGETGKNIARRLKRPANSVYQSLGRIRRTLLECINRRVKIRAFETGP